MDSSRITARGVRLAMVVAIVVVGWLAARNVRVAGWTDRVETVVNDAGPWFGPVLFVSAYVVGAVLLMPATAMNLTGGYLFGPWLGSTLVSIGSTLGAGVTFLLARTILRHRVERRVAADRRWTALDRAVTRRGARVVLLIRLNPIVPFNVTNYAFGLTGVGPGRYLVASWAGMLPATFAAAILGAATRQGSVGGWKFWAFAVVMAIASIVLLGRIAAHALAAIESEPHPLGEPVGCPSPGSNPSH